jgi:hypothetical protein
LARTVRWLSEFSELIKTSGIRQNARYITQRLIHLQMEQLMTGNPFPEVMGKFLEWCDREYIFCTWGNLDLIELQRNMRHYGMS